MSIDLFEKVRRDDLTGMNFIVLARMSNESKRRAHKKARAQGDGPWYLTGLDIDTREHQVTRCVQYIESRGGRVVDVYEEPHTSAYKKKKLRDARGDVEFRVIRPVFAAVLRDLQRGVSKSGHRIHGLMLADIDRLTRDNGDLETGH